jgi:hypothetical protein
MHAGACTCIACMHSHVCNYSSPIMYAPVLLEQQV